MWILTFRSTPSQCRPERLGGAPTKHGKQNMSPSQGGVIALISTSVVMVSGETPEDKYLPVEAAGMSFTCEVGVRKSVDRATVLSTSH